MTTVYLSDSTIEAVLLKIDLLPDCMDKLLLGGDLVYLVLACEAGFLESKNVQQAATW